MTTLDRINGEALAVPGLRIWGRRRGGRFSLIAATPDGAVEIWTRAGGALTAHGGVEYHSPRPLFPGDDPVSTCDILGGPCYTDGSSIAWNTEVMPLVAAGDSRAVLQLLADRHHAEFGTVTT